METEKRIEIIELLALYNTLLTDKQAALMEDYYHKDFSLQEIADILNITRTAVHDQITKATQKLYDLEKKLHLLTQKKRRQIIIQKIKTSTDDEEIKRLVKSLEKVD